MSNFTNVTVLGTGVLGSQIIMQAAFAGKNVVAYDIGQEQLDKLPARWEWMRGHYRNDLAGYSDEQYDAAISRISATTDLAEAVGSADVVIESIPEQLELKKDVWAKVGAAVPDHTILLTNTSSLRPSDFAEATGHPERFLALHFANTVWRNNTGEVMATSFTDKEVFEDTQEFARQINLEVFPIHKEIPGYIINSLMIPWLFSAAKLYLAEAADPQVIDHDWKVSLGSPRGPFEVFDIVGFNVAYHIIMGGPYAEMKPFAEQLKAKGMDRGRTGLGDGIGFYEYDEQGQVVRPNPDWVIYGD